MRSSQGGKLLLAAALLVFLPAAIVAAGGAGGVGFGAQYFDPGMSNVNHSLTYISGFGYGTTGGSWGNRIGGFGMAILAQDGTTAGGVGGMIVGREARSGPLVAGINLWYGIGGVAYYDGGYMVVFGQADFELGVAFLWMQVTAYAGMQAWGNLVPGLPLSDAMVYTPVLGIRMAWGGF